MKSPAKLAEAISGGSWRPYKHLNFISNRLVRAVTNPEQSFMSVQVSVRHGKGVTLDTPIPTPLGVRRMADLRPGDEIFGSDGLTYPVESLSPTWSDRPCFEVTFSDGETLVMDELHEWAVEVDGTLRVLETREMADHLTRPRHSALAIPTTTRHLPETDLLVDPWVLGYWLGNGHHSNGGISCHPDDLLYVKGRFIAAGYTVTDQTAGSFYARGLWPQLKEMGFGGRGNRFIPPIYLLGSIEQRTHLLNGLIDSDGYIAKDGQVEFCSIVEGLAADTQELIHTLGVKASLVGGDATLDGRFISRKYRVMFYWANAAASPRKRVRARSASPAQARRYITSVEPTHPQDTMCMEVASPDHTFLCGRSGVATRNSELITKNFIVWYMGMFPEKNVLIVCYNEDFAKRWGRATRDLYAEFGPELFGQTVREDVSSTTEWMTTGGGTVRSVGIGGPITGMGFDLVVIDDPIKNIEEALSIATNEKMREWYWTTLRTRLASKVVETDESGKEVVIRHGGTIVLTMARWTDYDLAAYVTGEIDDPDNEQPFPDTWEVIKLPAVAESPDEGDPTWRDELGRADGDPLWPEQWPIEALRPLMGTTAWDSLYQQNPVPRSGGVFPKENWLRVTHPGVAADSWRKARFWDTASTKGGGDWTVGVLMAIDPNNRVWVLDVIRERRNAAGVEELLVETARRDGLLTAIRYEEAKAAAGKAVTQGYARLLIGYDFRGIPVAGSKQDRATLYSAAQQNKLINLCEAPWVNPFIEEHGRFPKGRHDDQVDSAAAAFVFLTASGGVSVSKPSDVIIADPIDMIRARAREHRPTGPALFS